MQRVLVLGVEHYDYEKNGTRRQGASIAMVGGTRPEEDRGAGYSVTPQLRCPYNLGRNIAGELGESAGIYDLDIVAEPDRFNRGAITATVKTAQLVRLVDLRPLLDQAAAAAGANGHK